MEHIEDERISQYRYDGGNLLTCCDKVVSVIKTVNNYDIIETEGRLSVEWLESVLGLSLIPMGSDIKQGYDCGSCASFTYYETERGVIYIHDDRLCAFTNRNKILLREIDYALTHRPDLVGKL